MKIIELNILLFLLSIVAFSQEINLDSLYTNYIRMKSNLQAKVSENETKKCGFTISGLVRENINNFSLYQQENIKEINSRPSNQTFAISSNGCFKVHYDTTGASKIGFNLNDFLKGLDSVYNFEVKYLKYPKPPIDTVGSDSTYDIYLQDLGGQFYGYTEFENELSNSRYTSYIVMDNDFKNYKTSGLNGALVTAAHEFHHAIQIGNYIYRGADNCFYEISSTAMEDFVFDTINDYFNYLKDYFSQPDKNFYSYDGYCLGIWNIYLKNKFKTFDILKRQWELMPQVRALKAIETSVTEYGSNFRHEFNNFGIWCYYTNYRYKQNNSFSEGKAFPVLSVMTTLKLINKNLTTNITGDAAANSYFCIKDTLNNDTLFVIATNSDVNSAILGITDNPFQYCVSRDSLEGYSKLKDGLFINLTSNSQNYWTSSEILNYALVKQDNMISPIFPASIRTNYSYPNPFYYSKNYSTGNFIRIICDNNRDGKADLKIFTVAGELVYSSTSTIQISSDGSRKYYIEWNAGDNNKKKLATGVYIYIVKSGDNSNSGKLVIVND